MNILFKRIDDALTSALDNWNKKCEETKVKEEAERINQIRDNGESFLKASKEIFLGISKHIGSSKLTENNQSLLREFENHVIKTNYYETLDESLAQFKKLNFEAEKIKLIVLISNTDENVVIVGANGSGKSTFVDSFHETNLSNLTVISAQKLLFFSERTYQRETATTKEYTEQMQNDRNDRFKQDSKNSFFDMSRKIDSPFTVLLTALVNDDIKVKYEKKDNTVKSKWDQLLDIWRLLIPDITFQNDTTSRVPVPIQGGEKYDINRLSDGEKCILFYIGNVLLAKENGYIIVDEPETYLNPAIYNKMWDELINMRPDCKFIFTSHNPDFIMARENTSFVWVKKYIPPSNMDMRTLNVDKGIPLALQVELVGSRKPVMFCEGTKASCDYQVYSSLYATDYTVIPVKGHDSVIRYTEIFNQMQNVYGNTAVGIIDRDALTGGEIDSLKSKNIICLPYNEIEMLLLDEDIMKSVLEPFNTDNSDAKVKAFEQKVFSLMEKEKDKVIFILSKNRTDRTLSKLFINSKEIRTISELKGSIENISAKIDIRKIIDDVTNQVNQVLEGKKYSDLLSISPLKREIAVGLANEYIDKPYLNKAIARIKKSPELQKRIKNRIHLI
ncbi:AAA family ATPase (plasmid) [Lacticaseibacillus paracasei]|uniref:DUF4435 domain-containing protein n=1 Tax=Lacticaseibacillus paracasei TaxID=1597 RepID=UPI00338EC843